MKENTVIYQTKTWIDRFVIGLNICPFAKIPFQKDLIKYLVYNDSDLQKLLKIIVDEIHYLHEVFPQKVETSLIISPNIKETFEEMNDFNGLIEDLLYEMDLESHIQSILFHPEFRYEGSLTHNITNSTNQAPFPMIHLLRQDSIDKVATKASGLQIAHRNKILLNKLGRTYIQQLINEGKDD